MKDKATWSKPILGSHHGLFKTRGKQRLAISGNRQEFSPVLAFKWPAVALVQLVGFLVAWPLVLIHHSNSPLTRALNDPGSEHPRADLIEGLSHELALTARTWHLLECRNL